MINNLISLVRSGFSHITDHRKSNRTYKLVDHLMVGFAMFSLKDRSLLAFRNAFPMREENLKRVYGIEHVAGDTALRQALDGIEPSVMQDQFTPLITHLRDQGVLEQREVLGGFQAVLLDGTQHYCSSKTSCEHCLKRKTRGDDKFYHQLLAAVLAHPNQKTVFPANVEPIVQQDGNVKNDCEQNAAKRLIPKIAKALSEEKILLIADALYASGPFIKQAQAHAMNFLIGYKDTSGYVTIQAQRLFAQQKGQSLDWEQNGRLSQVKWLNQLIHSGAHQQLLVNYLEYQETNLKTGEIVYRNGWITDLDITPDNVKEMVDVGRCRWKVENETFNTLKNQGYHLEHNYGHGKKYLASILAILTFLAFAVDQIAQHLDQTFQNAWKRCKTKRLLWERIRQVFDLLPVASMEAIYRFVAKGKQADHPLLE